jgi:hypothetical protein
MFPMAEFGTQSVCRVCNYARVKRWRLEYPDKALEQYRRRLRHQKLVKLAHTDVGLREDLEFFRKE